MLVMLAKPHTASAVHHHGEESSSMLIITFSNPWSAKCSPDTIVYAARGHGTVVSEGGKKRQNLDPGDFALIPAFAEHQEVNDSDEEVLWIITRSGKSPIVENLEGWSKD